VPGDSPDQKRNTYLKMAVQTCRICPLTRFERQSGLGRNTTGRVLILFAARAYVARGSLAILALTTLFAAPRRKRLRIGVHLRRAWQRSEQETRLIRAMLVFSRARQWVALATLLLAVACSQPTVLAPGAIPASEWHTFEGNWSASGTRQTINLETNHRASIFDFTGSLVLTGDRGLGVGFRAKAIGFTDSLTGMQGRSVWTDENGDKVYSELKGEMVGTGKRITGTFLGGTGRFAGVTGEYSFQWKYVVESDDGTLSGRSVDLKGRARVGSAAVPPAGEHSQ
jgi:hypothetical protein